MNRTSWLSSIPTHWTVRRAAHVIDMDVGGTPSTSRPEYFDGDIPWLTIADMTSESITRCEKYLSRTGVEAGRIPWSRKGDLLYSFKLSIGKIAFTKIDLVTNEAIASIHSSSRIDLRYAYWMLPLAYEAAASRNIYGAPILNQQQLRAARLPMPPLSEQQQIADYLDHETAEIDSFIEGQQRLQALFDERILSSITKLTSGSDRRTAQTGSFRQPVLPPDWTLARLKSVSTMVTDGAHISPETEEGVFPFVSTRDVKSGNIDTTNCLRTSKETAAYMIRAGCKPVPGDILFSKDGTVGEVAVVTDGTPFVVASSLVIIRPRPDLITSDFLSLSLQSKSVKDQARSFMKGAGLPRISVANVSRLEIPVPSLACQKEITASLDLEILKTQEIIGDTDLLIKLAQERRAALITAAVTGQIDVTARNKPAAEQLEDDVAQGLHREYA